jgi:hypothetical protein
MAWSGRARDAVRWVAWGSKVLARGTGGVVRVARSGRARDALVPWMRFARAEDIPYEVLAGQGVKAVLFDLENTLIPPGGPFTAEGREIVRLVRAAGLRIGVVSNASASWVPATLKAEAIPFVAPAGKPDRRAFEAGCRLLGVRLREAVYVGDQLLTDVYGAQRAGMRAILIEPRYTKEAWSSRFQRVVAKGIVRATRAHAG